MKNFKKVFMVVFIALLMTLFFSYKSVSAETENYDKLKVTSVTITDRKTGKAPFDATSDMDGNDSTDTDEYLRTYDKMTYTLELTIARNENTTTPDEVITGGRIYVKATIPKDNGLSMGFLKDSWMNSYHYNEDNTEITAYWEIPSGSSPTSGTQQLSFTIMAMGYERELTQADMPKFEVWMEGNKPDNPNSLVDSKTIQDPSPIKITGAYYPNLGMEKGIVNNAGEKDGVRGQYIGFVSSIDGAGHVGSQVPTNSVKTKYSIKYEYKKAGTSSFINIATIETDNPINNTILYSYGRPFEPTAGFWPDENKNKSDDDWYKASRHTSSQSGLVSYDSGTMTASLPQNGNIISAENTGFYSYAMDDYVQIATQGYELFVPFYEPEAGEKYDYRLIVSATSLIYDDDLTSEIDPSESVIYNYSNYLTGNLKNKDFTADYSVYGETNNTSTPLGDSFNDIDPLPIDKRRGFVSTVSADEGPYEGGLERLIVWNSEAVDFAPYKLPAVTYSNSGIFATPNPNDAVIKYGIYKSNTEKGVLTDALVNSALNSDFDWYDSIQDAQTHGKIAAILVTEPTWRGYGVLSTLKMFLTPVDSIEAIGNTGFVRHKIVAYENAEKTIRHEYGYDMDYVKPVISEDGSSLDTPVTGATLGESYYITGMTLDIDESLPKYTYYVEEELIDLTINPSFTTALSELNGTTDFKVWIDIPIDLVYVQDSANRVPTSVVSNPNGTQTVTWEINDWNTENPLPTITCKLEINPYTANNSSKNISAHVSSPSVLSGPKSTGRTINIVNLSGSSLRQRISSEYLDMDQDTVITDYLYNIAQRTLSNVKTLEILPKNGDSNGSHFSGDYTLEVVSLAATQKMYYTTTSTNELGLATDQESNTMYIPNNYDLDTNTNWIEVNVGDTIPANATAISTFIPTILGTTDINYQFKLIPNGNDNGDKYYFKIAAFSDNLENVISSDNKTAVVTNRKITGYVFLDRNKNDIYDSSVDSILPNKEVKLYDESNTLIGTATTDTNGYYEFEKLSRGNYYIKYETESYETIVAKNIGTINVSNILNPTTGLSDLITDLDVDPVAEVMIADNKNVGLKFKEATITSHHYLVGTTTKVHEDDVFTKLYTETYITGAYGSAQLEGEYYNVYSYNNTNDGDPVSGVVAQDSYDIIYYYDHKPVEIRVRHLLANSFTPVHDDVVINSYYTAPYSTDPVASSELYDDYKNAYVYNNTNAGDPISGTVEQDQYVVVYFYDLKDVPITIHHYKVGTTDKVRDDEEITKKWGQPYVSSPYATTALYDQYKGLYAHNGTTAGDPVTGNARQDQIEIIYYYDLIEANITVHHYIVGTTDKVHEDDTFTKQMTQTYETNYYQTANLTNQNYYYNGSHDGDDLSGIVSKDTYEVIYYYELKPTTIIVHHYVKGTDTKLHDDDILDTYKYGDPYQTSNYESNDLNNTNYYFNNETGGDAVSGTVNKDTYDIIYYYELKPATVIVHHYLKDLEGNETTASVSGDETITPVYYGGTYETSRKNLTNYVEAGTGNTPVNGIVGSDTIEVIYYYQLKPATVTVHYYIEGTTTSVHSDDVYNKHYTDNYETNYYASNELNDEYKNKYEYLNSDGDDTNGTVTKDTYVVNYYYTLKTSKITIHHYLAGTTTLLVPDDVKTDKIGNTYTSTSKEPEGYRVTVKPDNETNEFTIEDQEFIYEYEKIMIKIDVDVTNGDGTVTGSEEVPYGDDSTPDNIVITPNEGNVISKIIVNGEEIEITDETKMILPGFTNVTDDITIEVEFKEAEKEEEPTVPDKEEPVEPSDGEEEVIDTETPITVDKILTYITLFIISLIVFVNIVIYTKRKFN